MKLLALAILFVTLGFAEEQADRAAIENTIHSLKTAKPVSVLFTADAESDLDRLNAIDRRMAEAAKQPWSEMTPPLLVIQSIRFLTSDVAIVNATNGQVGSLAQRIPVFFVMKKEDAAWKIASLRVLAPSGFL